MKYVCLLFILLTPNAWAQKIWLQAPKSVLRENDQSYAEFIFQKLKNTPSNPELISWGQAWLEAGLLKDTFFTEMEKFEHQQVITQNDRSFLVDLMAKLTSIANRDQKLRLERSLCKWNTLNRADAKNEVACVAKSFTLSLLKSRLPAAVFLVAEDMGLELETQYSIALSPSAVYNWQILSNHFKPILFRGTFAELEAQSFQPEKIIRGDCDSFAHDLSDLEVLSRGVVYFSPECQKSLNQPETSQARQWYEKNKSWVIPVGLALLAASVYQFKDKKIVIHKPK